MGGLILGRFGTIEQDDIGRALVAEFISSSAPNGSFISKMGRCDRDLVRLNSPIGLAGSTKHSRWQRPILP